MKKTMSDAQTIKEGWAIPLRANKAHYFRTGMSLCRKWMFVGKIFKDEQSEKQLPDDCKQCWREVEKEKKS